MGRLLALLLLLAMGGGAVWWLLREDPTHALGPGVDESEAQDGVEDDGPPALMASHKGRRAAPPRDVRVTVIEGAERIPVVGAIVTVSDVLVDAPAPTNEEGRTWVRRVPGDHGFRIDVRRGLGVSPPQSVRIGPNARGYTIELARSRTVSWKVVGENPPPPGTTIRITREADPQGPASDVVLQGQSLVVDGWGLGPVRAWAYAPDGRSAELRASRQGEGEPIEFRTSRHLTTRVTYADGAPAVGVDIEVMPLGHVSALRTIRTDQDGEARFAGLPPSVYGVRAIHASGVRLPAIRSDSPDPFEFGRADLSKGDGTVEGVVRSPRTIDIRFSGLSDPKLLNAAQVLLDDAPLHADVASGGEMLRAVWVPMVRREPQTILVRLPGYVPATVDAPTSTGREPSSVHVTLERGARMRVALLPKWHARFGSEARRVLLERFDAEAMSWESTGRWVPSNQVTERRPPDDGFLIDDLPPGRYRLVEPKSLLLSTEVEARRHGEPQTAVINFQDLREVRGRVETPKRGNAMEVRVVVRPYPAASGRKQDLTWGQPLPNGTFTLRVPINQVMQVSAEHPTWRLKDDKPVLVKESTQDVVLQLVKQHTVKIRLRGDYTKLPRFRGLVHTMPIIFWRRNEDGRVEMRETMARVVGPSAEFVRPDLEGLWNVMLDAGPHAPLAFENIWFGGNAPAPRNAKILPHQKQQLVQGGSIRLELDFQPTGLRPLIATARHLGAVPYERRSTWVGSDLCITGLGAGDFRITLRLADHAGPPIWKGDVKSDGTSQLIVAVKTN